MHTGIKEGGYNTIVTLEAVVALNKTTNECCMMAFVVQLRRKIHGQLPQPSLESIKKAVEKPITSEVKFDKGDYVTTYHDIGRILLKKASLVYGDLVSNRAELPKPCEGCYLFTAKMLRNMRDLYKKTTRAEMDRDAVETGEVDVQKQTKALLCWISVPIPKA